MFEKKYLVALISIAAFTFSLGVLAACGPKTLPSPSNLQINDDEMLSWDEVKNAKGYVVELNGEEYETSENCFDLFALLVDPNISYEIRILALGDSKFQNDSEWSNSISYTLDQKEKTDWLARKTSDGSGLEVKPSKSVIGKIAVPATITDIPVVGIAKSAFSGHTKLTGVVLPNGIKTIPYGAFQNCTSLKRIAFDKELIAIEKDAFQGCSSLTSFTIPSTVEKISSDAFSGCSSLKSVEFSDGLREIGTYAFYNCAIEQIALPFTLNKIQPTSFGGHENLRSITVSDENPFYKSEQNCLIEKSTDMLILGCKTSVIPSSVKSIGGKAFSKVGFDSITIPHGVTEIEMNAFAGCKNLQSVIFPDSLITLGEQAFEYCERLEKVVIPQSLKTIGNTTFENCPSLTSVHVDEKNPFLRSENNCIIAKSNHELLFCPQTVSEIPKNVEIIGRRVFYNRNFTEFTIPVGVKEIKSSAFAHCYSLRTVYIPQTVTIIEGGAFESCGRLSVVLPETLTDIGGAAFIGFGGPNDCPLLTVYVSNYRLLDGELQLALKVGSCEIAYENGYPYVTAIETISAGEKTPINAHTYYDYGFASKYGLHFPSYVPTRKGYTFQGWALAEGGEVVFANVPAVDRYGDRCTTTLTEEQLEKIPYDSKLYAVWEKTA